MSLTLSLWDEAPYIFFTDGTPPESVRAEIDEELSYEVEGHEYSDAWQSGEWDGREHLLRQSTNGNWYFPVGLLDRVRKVLDTYGVDYDVEGVSRPGRGPVEYEWNFEHDLRDYQTDAVSKALSYGSGVVCLPTGTGKTVVGLRLAYELGWPFMVVVDNAEIADQWVERIEETLGVEPSCYYGGTRENGDVMVALYQSIYMDGEIVEDVRLDHPVLLPDECHSVAANTFNRVAMSHTADYRFGFSATPERSDNAELEVFAGCGPLIVDYSVEEAISKGYLAEPEWDIVDAPHEGGHYQDWHDEYTEAIVKNPRRNKLIARKVREELDHPTLVTVERVEHGERLTSLIPGSRFVHGSASDREENVAAFRDGDLDVMVATRGIVGEGFDVPDIRSFVVAGGMQSETSMIQQVGRALRPGETGKATLVDMMDYGRWIGKHSEERLKTYADYYGDEYGPL